jgi:hypothetical protein
MVAVLSEWDVHPYFNGNGGNESLLINIQIGCIIMTDIDINLTYAMDGIPQ